MEQEIIKKIIAEAKSYSWPLKKVEITYEPVIVNQTTGQYESKPKIVIEYDTTRHNH